MPPRQSASAGEVHGPFRLVCELEATGQRRWIVHCTKCGREYTRALKEIRRSHLQKGCNACKGPSTPANLAHVGDRIGVFELLRFEGMSRRGQSWQARCTICGRVAQYELPQLKHRKRGVSYGCKNCAPGRVHGARAKSGEARLAQRKRKAREIGDRAAFAYFDEGSWIPDDGDDLSDLGLELPRRT